MAEDHETQKPGNSPGPGPKVLEIQNVTKEQVAQRFCSWTVPPLPKGKGTEQSVQITIS